MDTEAVLETVPNPHPGTLYLVRFTCPELTSLCPVTGQPDFEDVLASAIRRDGSFEQCSASP